MPKRNFASVTQTPCGCGFLQRSANDPDLPIVFDKQTNEFQFHYPSPLKSGEPAQMIIYHCPFCGGAAPESTRDRLFAVVSLAETTRLQELLKDIRTPEDAIALLGPPDIDNPFGTGSTTPERDGEAPVSEYFRTLIYNRLSDVADVWITDSRKGRVHIAFQGKWLGEPDPSRR